MPERTIPAATQGGDAVHDQETTRERDRYVEPPVDIYETPDGLTVLADLPGVDKEGLRVEVKDDILTLQGLAHHTLPGHPIYREYELARFFRQFQLSDRVDTSKITAELKHGVLILRLPKAEETKPKQIPVQVG